MTTDETIDRSGEPEADAETPTLRQKLHSVTGDRDGEAKALADAAGGDADEEEARSTVARVHGDLGTEQSPVDHDVATPADLEHPGDGQPT